MVSQRQRLVVLVEGLLGPGLEELEEPVLLAALSEALV